MYFEDIRCIITVFSLETDAVMYYAEGKMYVNVELIYHWHVYKFIHIKSVGKG